MISTDNTTLLFKNLLRVLAFCQTREEFFLSKKRLKLLVVFRATKNHKRCGIKQLIWWRLGESVVVTIFEGGLRPAVSMSYYWAQIFFNETGRFCRPNVGCALKILLTKFSKLIFKLNLSLISPSNNNVFKLEWKFKDTFYKNPLELLSNSSFFIKAFVIGWWTLVRNWILITTGI